MAHHASVRKCQISAPQEYFLRSGCSTWRTWVLSQASESSDQPFWPDAPWTPCVCMLTSFTAGQSHQESTHGDISSLKVSFFFFNLLTETILYLKHFKTILNFHNSEPDHVLQRIVTTAMISDLHDLNYRENYNWHLHQMLWMPSDSLRSRRRCGTSLSDCVRVCIFASVNSQA